MAGWETRIPGIGSISPDKTTFLALNNQNLFNPAAAMDGYRLTTAGAPFADPLNTLSDYIPVVSGQSIKVLTNNGSSTARICGYDTSRQFVKLVSSGVQDGTALVVDFTGFIRISLFLTAKSGAQVVDSALYKGEFVPFGYELNNDVKLSVKEKLGFKLRVSKVGNVVDIRSSLDDTKDIILSTGINNSTNNHVVFANTVLLNKDQAKSQGETVHANSDDSAPIRTFTTLGGNHGYTNILGVTMSGHGKTSADLGSRWTDGTTTYTLLKIGSTSALYFGCPYTVLGDGTVTSAYVSPVANLTHVSGATNTAVVNVSTLIASSQLYPSVNNNSIKYFLDGVEIAGNGVYYGNEFVVRESYNVMDYKALLDYAQANIGVSYANNNVEGVVRVAIDYVFGVRGSITIHHNYRALKKHSITSCGFMQSAVINLAGHKVFRYMPNVLPKGGVDFKTPVDLTAYNQSLVYTTADLVDPTIPPNRTVDWLQDAATGARKVGFTMGYIIDKSNSKHADRIANSANRLWDMRNTLKNYPTAIEGKTYNPGDYLNFIGYRNYMSPNVVPSDATNFNIVKDNKDTYIYIDYHANVSFKSIPLAECAGKSINVVEKSPSFTLHNNIVDSDGVLFSVSGGYGYAILKLN